MHLVLLFTLCCCWRLNTATSMEQELTTASVLPYILKRPNQAEDQKNAQNKKHYTLLAAATTSTQLTNDNSIEEVDQNKIPDNVALAKSDFPHSWQHGASHFNGHDLWNDFSKYYYATIGGGSDARPPLGFGGEPAAANPAANVPATVLVLLNLGLLSYILLAIVGALARLLNIGAGFNTAPFSGAAPFFNHNNVGLGAGQFGYWRTANENLYKKSLQTVD